MAAWLRSTDLICCPLWHSLKYCCASAWIWKGAHLHPDTKKWTSMGKWDVLCHCGWDPAVTSNKIPFYALYNPCPAESASSSDKVSDSLMVQTSQWVMPTLTPSSSLNGPAHGPAPQPMNLSFFTSDWWKERHRETQASHRLSRGFGLSQQNVSHEETPLSCGSTAAWNRHQTRMCFYTFLVKSIGCQEGEDNSPKMAASRSNSDTWDSLWILDPVWCAKQSLSDEWVWLKWNRDEPLPPAAEPGIPFLDRWDS